jgi:hypothetical protein
MAKETKKVEEKDEKVKKAEEKKEEKPSRIDLAQRLNDVTFKNDQIKMVRDLQSENAKLKQMVGRRNRRGGSEMPRIQGLGKLEGNLGMQFKKRGIDY